MIADGRKPLDVLRAEKNASMVRSRVNNSPQRCGESFEISQQDQTPDAPTFKPIAITISVLLVTSQALAGSPAGVVDGDQCLEAQTPKKSKNLKLGSPSNMAESVSRSPRSVLHSMYFS